MEIFRRQGLSFRRRRRIQRTAVRQAVILVLEGAAALALSFVLVYGWGMRVRVSGDSMETTLSDGESVLVNRFIYRLTAPKSGDVVVFLPNGNENNPYYIKRVVGTPGDTVQITDGVIYVNGEMFDVVDTEAVANPGVAEEGLTLGENEYFVIGDSRNNSEDSRYESFGNVMDEYIVGKAWFRYNAFNDLGRIK